MKSICIEVVFWVCAAFFIAVSTPAQSIVGTESVPLRRGKNRVDIHFDAIDPLFSTMDSILTFAPENGVIGDELEFVLDGKVQRYAFESFDGTNYLLKATSKVFPSSMSLDSLPWCPTVWINHKSDTSVSMVFAGEVAGEYGRLSHPIFETAPNTSSQAAFTIRLVSDEDPEKSMSLKLEGGHISLIE